MERHASMSLLLFSKDMDRSASHQPLDLIDSLLFIYFFTLHADQLSVAIGGFSFRLNNIAAIVLLLILLIRFRGKLLMIDKSLCMSLAAIGISLLLSFVNSLYKTRCLFFLIFYCFTALYYVFLPYFLIMHYDNWKVWRMYFLSFVCVGIYAVLQLLASGVGFSDPFAMQTVGGGFVRPNAFAFEPSYYALYMTAFVMMANFHFLNSPLESFFIFRPFTLPKIISLNILLLISMATSAAFAYFVFFLVLVVVLGGGGRKNLPDLTKRFFYFVLICGCSGLVLGFTFPYLMKQFFMKFFFSGFMAHHSFFERWVGIENAWKIFLEHPWMGVGLGGIPPYLFDAWKQGNTHFTYLGIERGLFYGIANPFKLFEPTNVFTEIMASLGVVGLGAFALLLASFARQVRRAVSSRPSLAFNLLISVAVMLIVLQFNQGLFRTYIWVHFTLAFAYLEKMASQASVQVGVIHRRGAENRERIN